MEVKEIEVRVLRPNNGEIDGLPRNPRKISKKQLEKLKKSLADAPEMLRLRELICVEHPDGPVVIAGNQRLEAAKALQDGATEAVIEKHTSERVMVLTRKEAMQ